MTFVVATPILPTSITSSSMNAYFLNGLLRVQKNVESDLKATTATWKTKHPKFKVMVRYAGGDARVIGDTDGESLDNDIWHYLNEGTSVRYATMTPDFRPKTRKRHIGSMAGAGGKMFVSKKYPRPGIEAREFSEAITDNNIDILHQEMIKAVDNALTKGKFGVFR